MRRIHMEGEKLMVKQEPLVDVRDLKTYFYLNQGVVKAVDGVTFSIMPGETMCIVGESGCGKSVTARSLMQIVETPGRVVEGSIFYQRQLTDGNTETMDIGSMSPRDKRLLDIRGREISMIFQEPMSSMSPLYTVGDQIGEVLLLHGQATAQTVREKTIELLRSVGIPRPELRVDSYPFQLSGGMCQRCVIAMAIACRPTLLIADEPTTALDVTTQAQILDLIAKMQQELGMSVMFITHDLGVVAEIADSVTVMYLGRVVERGPVDDIFHNPLHPYTQALLRSIPRVENTGRKRLDTIRGMVPDPFNRPTGCTFYPRCDAYKPGVCDRQEPVMHEVEHDHWVACCSVHEDTLS